MRAAVILVAILSSTLASRLVSLGNIEDLFKKYVKNEITEEERKQLDDIIEVLHRPEHASAKMIEYASDTRMTLDCLICRSAFAALAEGVSNGQTDAELSGSISNLCILLGIENYNVCTGAVALNMPILTYIIKTTPEATPRAFCGLVLQTVGNPNTCRIDDSRFEWEVDLPAPSATNNVPPVDTRPLKVAVLTDAHIDPLYEAYGVAECDEPTCCRVGQSPATTYLYKSNVEESVLQRSLVNNSGELMLDLNIAPTIREMRSLSRNRYTAPRNPAPAGYWGDYRNCDSPIWAFDDVIETIAETHKDIDVVYYIGDTIDHGVWETSYDLINDMNRYIVEKIRKHFGDDVTVIPVIGNHESQPTNQFAPFSVTEEFLNTTWLYEALANKWDFYLTEEAKDSLKQRGDFSMSIRPGLRVISINNNVSYKYNWWIVYDPLDGKKHLEWLIDELFKAEQAGEKVHILAHIPPGVHDLTHTWTREYNRIINRFSSTIMAEFNGHTHSDEFKVFYNPEGAPINVAWGAGSATSYTFYNLNYKIVTFNPVTYASKTKTVKIDNQYTSSVDLDPVFEILKDTCRDPKAAPRPTRQTLITIPGQSHNNQYVTYENRSIFLDLWAQAPENIINYAYNLTEANLTPNRRPHWFQLYDMKNTYGLSDLSAASVSDLIYRMVTTDKHLLDMYAAFYSKLSDSRWPWCNNDCKLDQLCKTVVTVLWERQKCEELNSLFNAN